jgi:predicted Rdx family selenoprotein
LRGEGYDADAIEGEKSQFDVVADGGLIFSKQAEGRFPETAEVLGALRAA